MKKENLEITTKEQAHAFLLKLSQGKVVVAGKLATPGDLPEGAKAAPHNPLFYYFPEVKASILKCFSACQVEPQDFGGWDKFPVYHPQGANSPRRVPGAIVRLGGYVSPKAILMPSFINVGAYVSEGSMVDTWATVGSCAYIGKNVHLSGGVGIGGVLEPPQASPVFVGDHAFIGSRAIVVEGAVIDEEAVLGAGVVITASTKVYDSRPNATQEFFTGYVPPRCVVIPASKPRGNFATPCALIVGERKPSTDLKTSLNEALRDYDVSA